MPIRTNRGRAAVYRRLWGWPLRSPRHLVGALVGLLVVAIAVAIVVAHTGTSAKRTATGGPSGVVITSEEPTPLSTAPAAGITTSDTTTPTVTRLASPPETPVSAPAPTAALDVIDAWGKAWVNHPVGMTNAQWLAQLKPYTTSEFLPQMSSVDVTNIDATEVTGTPKTKNSYIGSVEALLPTNAGELDIIAIATPQGWQVSSYMEAS
ncbi:MAG TPA: hypothetical protein VFX16_18605 [Pseudonocardiaceae bacterium]|nr:hypothetical protein [Pseudonocardiaceae bacterium]